MKHAWKVGLLVVIFGAMVVGAYNVLGQSLFAPKPTILNARFADASGISPGTRVLMAGVPIGSVQKVVLDTPHIATVRMAIDAGFKIPAGSRAVIPSSLIGLGDNPIQIVAPEGVASKFLAPGETVEGVRLGPLSGIAPDLVPTLNVTLEELNKTLASARGLIDDQKLRGELVAVLQKTNETLDRFGALAGTASATLQENRATIDAALQRFAVAMSDVQKSAKMASELLADPRYKEQANEILANLRETTRKAGEVMESTQALVTDPKLRSALDKAATDMATITDSGTRIAADTEKIAGNGVLASENVVELTKKINALADEARAVMEKVNQFFSRPAKGSALSLLETEASIIRESSPGRFRTDFNTRFPIPGGSIHAGIYDAFETNKLNLQLGRALGTKGEYRYGVYGGQPSLGVDYALAPRMSVRGDLYGLNDPRLDVRAQFDFRNDFLGWIGVHRVADRNQLAVGIGIRK